MFNKEKTNPSEKNAITSATLISAGTVVKGDLRCESDLRIDGAIHGNVSCSAKVVIGPSGFVEGNIDGVHADLSGRLVGNVTAKEVVQLRASGNVHGNISAASLQIEAGAVFNGQSQMGPVGNVVLMKEGETIHAKAN
ncbi:bactofilin family protein [Flavisolibacter nicotianae]|uniref:bactofilin family protein n=1 Tax=Flavisolibacter nicotianae TaxID=2364882 RepID=UPI000EB2059C|nr:polymer-forming cytoskeletal protein [Flavisolibacter nicotianae]